MKQAFYRVAELFWARKPRAAPSPDPASVRSVLVVRQHDQLGDFLLATPVFPALRARFPNARIGALVRGYFASLLEGHPDVDEILTWKPSGGWSLPNALSFWRSLRGRWDLAVVLNTVSHSSTSDQLARLSGAKTIVGSSHRLFPGTTRNFMYDLVTPPAEGIRHQTLRNLDILKPLGVEPAALQPLMTLTGAEKTGAEATLKNLGWDGSKRLVGLHLGAGKKENRWPVDNFAELANILQAEGYGVVVTWGLGEEDLAEAFKDLFQGPSLYAGAPRLRPLAALFSALSGLVVNDTGMLHLAAAVDTPLVAPFGPSVPEEWCPLGPKIKWVKNPDQRIESVTVDQVWERIRDLLVS